MLVDLCIHTYTNYILLYLQWLICIQTQFLTYSPTLGTPKDHYGNQRHAIEINKANWEEVMNSFEAGKRKHSECLLSLVHTCTHNLTILTNIQSLSTSTPHGAPIARTLLLFMSSK